LLVSVTFCDHLFACPAAMATSFDQGTFLRAKRMALHRRPG